ncbi:MAG: M56 family metallopeptidase [Phenylobacterium sp.]|nr:M56 family metallopeptidase [Phenylobacterium sp.]
MPSDGLTSEILAALLRSNLAAAVAILVVLAARWPMRRLFGPEIAYGLWALPPIVLLASLMPPPVMLDDPGADPFALAHDRSAAALIVWGVGVAVMAGWLAVIQARYMAAARRGLTGPSVVGIVAPRILMPADDGTYTPLERELIRAHEREHVRRGDPRARAVAAAFQTLCWFNPFAHLAAHVMRLDQEMACDAAVVRRRPLERGSYARTLLKSQLATQSLPFGCHWPARSRHPLETRVAAMSAPAPRNDLAGSILLAAAMVSAGLTAWASQPPGERHPPPVIAFFDDTAQRAVSVLLIRTPPRETPPAPVQ